MPEVRRLIWAVLLAGALAGIVLFLVQRVTVIPLIQTAESFEPESHPAEWRHTEEWKPAEGWQRVSLTAAATLLSSIGMAAILFGFAVLARIQLRVRSGIVLGLAAFVCFSLAPSLGLPPEPPGVPVADVADRQVWWAGTVIATALGLWMLARGPRTWLVRVAAVICIIAPHWIGAPKAVGENEVPEALLRQFAIASLASMAVFWVVLGASAGYYLAARRNR